MKYRSVAHIRLNQYPKNEACSSNTIEYIRQNHCTTKYRSLTYIYICRSLNIAFNQYLQYNIPSPKSLQNIRITGPWNVGHWPTYILCDKSLHHMDPIFQLRHLSINSLKDIRQNHWTMKYRSLTYIQNTGHWPIYRVSGQCLHQTESISPVQH